MKKTILYINIIIFFLIIPCLIKAQEVNLIFTEIMYNIHGSDDGNEWVELYNNTQNNIDILSGSGGDTWRFFDGNNHILELYQGEPFIMPEEFIILSDDPESFLSIYTDFSGTILDTVMNLNNSEEEIALSFDGGDNYFSNFNYNSNWGGDGNNYTLEKINLDGNNLQENWQESFVEFGTPGIYNSTGETEYEENNEEESEEEGEESGENDNILPDPIINCPDSLSINENWIFNILNIEEFQEYDINYIWNFLDNIVYTEEMVEYFFIQEGQYNISLEISTLDINQIYYCSVNIINNENIEDDDNEWGGNNDNQENNYWSQISISEFIPNPKGSDTNEWIELYNNGIHSVDLNGFKLQDNSANIFTLEEELDINLLLNKNQYLILPKNITHIALNNTGGDCLKLYNPEDLLLEEICYQDIALEDRSYAKNNNSFMWTKEVTPGEDNIFIDNLPPIAKINLLSENLIVGEKIILSAEDSIDPEEGVLKYYWNFGDETTADEKKENHIYTEEGTFLVKLKVIDNKGIEDETTLLFDIKNKETKDILLEDLKEIDFNIENLFISEFIPNPKGSDENEWIELYNNSDKEINLLGWKIDDQINGSSSYTFLEEVIINPNSFLILNRNETNITLNNTNDSVRILTPLGDIWQEITYDNIPEGSSYSWDFTNNEWFINTLPNPNEKSIFIPEPEIIWSISNIEDAPENENILITGILLHEVNSDNLKIYLADIKNDIIDYSNIIEIYFHKKDFPELNKGDILQITGKLSKKEYLSRLKIKNQKDILLLDKLKNINNIETFDIDDIDDDILGDFISIKGKIKKKTSKNIYLKNDSEDIEIRVYTNFNTKYLKLEKDTEIIVSGILMSASSGFKLVPFSLNDILVPEIIKMASINLENNDNIDNETNIINKESNKNNILFYILIWFFIIIIFYFIKKNNK